MGEAAGVVAAMASDGNVRGVSAGKAQARLAAAGVYLGRPKDTLPAGV
jgi:hypothetical protein